MSKETVKKVIKDAAFYARIGKKGGSRTRDRMLKLNPNYYSEIGLRGGESMKKRGFDFYSKIGKMGGRKSPETEANV